MVKLVWVVMIMTMQGPAIGKVPETTTFTSKQSCEEFGTAMSGRIEDWVRGLHKLDWNNPVQAKFVCEVSGKPA